MRDRGTALAALELEASADQAAIEQAYRRLIKQYHPDRSGGDAARAAEINRAYFELRRASLGDGLVSPPASVEPPRRRAEAGRHRRRPRRPRRPWRLAAIAVVGALALQGSVDVRQLQSWAAPWAVADTGQSVPIVAASLEEPLSEETVAAEVTAAARLVSQGDDAAVAERSRDCHRRFRARPEITQLDRCAAFDNAVAAIEDRDPMHDSGPFNASALTARQMTAASLLSNDYLSIERRLDRIRTSVQLRLNPPASVAPVPESEPAVELPPPSDGDVPASD